MKKTICIFLFLLLNTAQARDYLNYTCEINKEFNLKFSLINRSQPQLSIYKNKNIFAICSYDNTPATTYANINSQSPISYWNLNLNKCDYYGDKNRNFLSVSSRANFKQPLGTKHAYLNVLDGHQPLFCLPIID